MAPQALEVIDANEAMADAGENDDWIRHKWKLTALHEIQDVFDAPLYPSEHSPLNMFHLWYFYFESRHLLTESLLSGFQGLYSASNATLRVFLEFSVLQLYYYTASNEAGNYKRLERYFKERTHPSWNVALQKTVPSNRFCRPIKSRIDYHLKGLSKSAAHAYHPIHSPRQHSPAPGHSSLEGIYFWHLTDVVVQSILWAYYVNFPMLFSPRNPLRKFGFNAPVGLFADDKCATAVRNSLAETDYELFLEYASNDKDAKELCRWIDSHPNLSDEQIMDTWDTDENGELSNIYPQGYAKHVAKIRVLREAMALAEPSWTQEETAGGEGDIDLLNVFSYKNWSKIYKQVKV